MADIDDQASDFEMEDRQRRIDAARAQAAKFSYLKPGDECANMCGEKPVGESAFCSDGCCQDFTARRLAKRRNGS